jgi:serine/threonine protein kinase
MPPEQARGRHIDGRADLFAVGATMFRLLTGRRIHDAATDFDLLMKMAKEPAPPLASVLPGLPHDVCHVIDRALAFDRDRRYVDAAMMLDDVRSVRENKRPLHALRFMDLDAAVDRAAMTMPRGRSAPPAAGPPMSVEIPVVWSVPAMSVESPFIDIELSSSVLVPELDGATEVGEAPQMTPRLASHAAALEMTLLSPSGEPDAGPKKDA